MASGRVPTTSRTSGMRAETVRHQVNEPRERIDHIRKKTGSRRVKSRARSSSAQDFIEDTQQGCFIPRPKAEGKTVARERVLKLGMRTDDRLVEVRSGLKEGERLVITGAEALKADSEVTLTVDTPAKSAP